MKLLYSPWVEGETLDYLIGVVQAGRNALRKKISDAMERNRAVKLLDSLADPKNWTVVMDLSAERPVKESFRAQFKASPGYSTLMIDEVEAKYPGCFGSAIKDITTTFERQADRDAGNFHRLLTPAYLAKNPSLALANLEPEEA